MKKTIVSFVPSNLYEDEDIPVDVLAKLLSNVLPLADALENGLELSRDYVLSWAVKWVGLCDNPQCPALFAKVSLCRLARVPRGIDELSNPRSWVSRGHTPRTSPVLISAAESKVLLQITENEVSIFGDPEVPAEEIIPSIQKELKEFMQHLQPEPCTAP